MPSLSSRSLWGRAALALPLVLALVAPACSAGEDDVLLSGSQPQSAEADSAETVDEEASTADTEETSDEGEGGAATPGGDRAFYILPPGNYGGIPTNDDSLDQLPLYDGLTPLRGDITDDDIEEFFLPADFSPVGETVEEPTGRPGTTILYDEFGVAHITGETREDLAFGAGWVTARDRGLWLDLGRGAARAAVADIPGIDAFDLVTSGQTFTPSEAAEQLVTDQVQLIRDTYGDEGEEIIADAQAYADGINAFGEANGQDRPPATVNDVVAVTAFIGSIFGAGGGGEAGNAELLSVLQNQLGEEQGRLVWEDLHQVDDPEAPTTIDDRFDYGAFTGGDVTGSAVIDGGSIISLDPREPVEGSAPQVSTASLSDAATEGPPTLTASNWLTVAPEASTNGNTLAVMGPQLGYYYPEIVQQIHLTGPGIEAQGAAVPGLAMYMLIGRTRDYAWSLTSATNDVRDVFVEVLCEPDGSEPTRASGFYEHDGNCIPFQEFEAGTLGDTSIRYPISVHGPVIGTATSEGAPVALTSKRSTFGRDGLNLGALKDMTEGDADTQESFFEVADKFGFTFNWGYANREGIGFFSSGYLPVRAEGLDRRLPTVGTGEYEWEGFLEQDQHPHADGHPTDRLLNWNNQAAPGFMHADNNLYGSVHRVEGFDQWPDQVDLAGVVGVMNRSATEDVRSTVWPVISEVLAGGEPPSELAGQVVDLLDQWVADDAPLLDADDDGEYDEAGALIFDEVFDPLAAAVAEPLLGDLIFDDDGDVSIPGIGSASLVDKDLRSLLGKEVDGPFNVAYCGEGDLDGCRATLWAVVDDVSTELAGEQGADPAAWRREGLRTTFVPELIPDDFRSTNRPTFQQVLEFSAEG